MAKVGPGRVSKNFQLDKDVAKKLRELAKADDRSENYIINAGIKKLWELWQREKKEGL